ncbi:uncharacterized protein LOC131159742 isoform X2 [Malania oleifera]|uniref:uncharacterized protein LOC131159742 isoform X2 n=1 Tax=Malania oleifera TaxID=397392 RepID=UPI0025ADAD9B|nr:uncharacterized protein LOC131159742 isoform X2 [Malania oleifera]
MDARALPILVLFITQFAVASAAEPTSVQPPTGRLRPAGQTEYRVFKGANATGDSLLPATAFQVCARCKCCGAGVCTEVPQCCYGIQCDLPDKPYGVCAFEPLTCNCTSCPS